MMNQFNIKSIILSIILIILLGIGFAIRLIDIDDPPLDFNPTRQLRSAIIARGIYYEGLTDVDPGLQTLAIRFRESMERLEPPIIESIVAFIYKLVGSETLWVSRIVTSIFWIVGAGVLYDLGRRLTTPAASLVGICYFLFLPFSIRASRSFQPDPGMVMLIISTGWAIYLWYQKRSWIWIIITGLLGGLTGLVKPMGLIFVGGIVSGVIFYSAFDNTQLLGRKNNPGQQFNLKSLFNLPIFVLVVMIVLPFLVYFMSGNQNGHSSNLANWTIITRWREILDPGFLIRWMTHVDNIMYLGVVFAGLLGILLTHGVNRALITGYWVGYFLFGVTFPYHIQTHDYYHLPLIGLVALSLMPLIEIMNDKVSQHSIGFRIVYLMMLFVMIFYNGWIGRSILLGNDYREHPQFWQEVGNSIPEKSEAIGVTQDYGFRLTYYGWRKISIWPQGGGIKDFAKITSGKDIFLVTAKNQLSEELAHYLETNFQILSQGMGYQIYNLVSD
jgi:hypothetical protein